MWRLHGDTLDSELKESECYGWTPSDEKGILFTLSLFVSGTHITYGKPEREMDSFFDFLLPIPWMQP
jgi:hypothetical protein